MPDGDIPADLPKGDFPAPVSERQIIRTVSYTHLDVYKRQKPSWTASAGKFSRTSTATPWTWWITTVSYTHLVGGIGAAALLHRNDQLLGDLGEGSRTLGILCALGFLNVMPFGMSGHCISTLSG